MVFESFVVSILNKYLGKYIKNLDVSNLDLGVWNGNAVLTDLTLKENALADFDLPVEVRSGYIGKLSLTIPWSNIYTKPVVVKIEDVFAIATPLTDYDYDAEKAEEYLKAAKRRKLDAIAKSIAETRADNANEPTSQDYTLFEKMTAQIIKNVQVFIHNIHVRYEDKVTNPNSPFAVGFTLKHLTAETTDEFWEACVVEATVKRFFKFVSLDSLSVYWNCNITADQLYSRSSNWKTLLRSSISTIDTKNNNYDYVLEPFSVEARVKIDQTTAVNFDKPKVVVDVVQQDMILTVSKTQFHDLMNLVESFQLMRVNEPYRKYRPDVGVKENVKSWWKYAYTAIVEEKIRIWSWSNIRRHREIYHSYMKKYKIKLTYDEKKMDSRSLNPEISDLENQLDVSSILIAREHAKSEYKLDPDSVVVPEPARSSGWWGWVFGENKNEVNEATVDNDFDLSSSLSISTLSNDEKERLYDALDYTENGEATNYPVEYVKYVLQLSLESFQVQMFNELRSNISCVRMDAVGISVQHRPASSNTSFSLEVKDVNVYGHSSNNLDEPQPHILALQSTNQETILDLLKFSFDVNPVELKADYKISLNLQPVKIVHDTNTLVQFMNFFKMPESRALRELAEVASSGLEELQHRTRLGLEYSVSHQTIVYFDISLSSPRIVIPEYGSISRANVVFIVDFGHLIIKTDLNPIPVAIEQATESELEEMLSDHFDVNLTKMQIIIADKDVNWEEAHAQSSSIYHLLPACEIDMKVIKNTNDMCYGLPEITLKGVLPSLDIILSEQKYKQFMQLISNSPLLTEPLDDINDRYHLQKDDFPQTLSRHSSRLSLKEASSIQNLFREALTRDDFKDAMEELPDSEEWFVASDKFQSYESPPRSSSAQSSPAKTVKSDRVTLSGDFVVSKVSIFFNKYFNDGDQPYVVLVISKLSAQISTTENQSDMTAVLGSVHLTDYMFREKDGSPLTILSSVADKNLISFSYTQINHHDESNDDGEVEYSMKTQFNTLNVLLHQEGIIAFQNFVLDLFERNDKPNMRKFGQRVSSMYLDVIPEDEMVQLDVPSASETKVESTNGRMNIKAMLDEVLITLSSNECPFGLLRIHGLCVDAMLEQKQKRFKSSLERFEIEAVNQGSLYRKLLSMEDDNVCDVEVVVYSNETGNGGNPLSPDMQVSVLFGRLKLIYLCSFFTTLQNFFASFASDENRMYVHEATNEAVQIQVESLRESDPKISLNVNVKAPLIKIPASDICKHGVLVDLGCLKIDNSLKYRNFDHGDILVDEILIGLECFQITKFIDSSSWTGTYNIVDPTGLNIVLTRCLSDTPFSIPNIDIELKVEELSTSVDGSDFALLIRILAENFPQSNELENASTVNDNISDMPEVEQHQLVKLEIQDTSTKKAETSDQIFKIQTIINKVNLHFPNTISGKRLPYLELNIHKLQGDVVITGNDYDGKASLGGLFLYDFRNTGGSDETLAVLESLPDENLICLKYRKSEEQSEDSRVHSSQILEVLTTVIKLHFVKESVLNIQELFVSLTQSARYSTSKAKALSRPSLTHSLSSSVKQLERLKPTKSDIPQAEEHQVTANSHLKLIVNVKEVDITLGRGQTKILHAKIQDVFTEVLCTDEKLVIYSRQKGLAVTDLNPLTKYPDVITIQGGKLFDFEYQTLPPPDISSDNNNEPCVSTYPHSVLSLDIGKIRFVFLYKLISDIQTFLQALVSPETTSYSYEVAQKTVYDQLQQIEQQGTRIKLRVNIEAPLIIIPNTSKSKDCLIADLGKLVVDNNFTIERRRGDESTEQVVVVDNLNTALQSVQLSRGELNTTSHVILRRLLVQPMKMTMSIARSMKAGVHWLPYLNISMKLDHIEMNVDEDDYQLLTCVMQQNFAEDLQTTDGLPIMQSHFVDAALISDDNEINEELATESIWEDMTVDFTFFGLNLTLFTNDKKSKSVFLEVHDSEEKLCTCELQESSGNLVRKNDFSMELNLCLYGCVIEDARPTKVTAFPRMLSHSTEQEHGKRKRRSKHSASFLRQPSMIELLYEQTPSGEMKVTMTLLDPTLYISFPLLWSLIDFFTMPAEETRNPELQRTISGQEATPVANPTEPYKLEVKGCLKNPEIVLLGEPENPKSSALIVQTNIDFNYKVVNDQQTFSTTSKGLVVFSCRYPEREKTLYKVVRPCAVDFQYSYPGQDCSGQEIHVQVDEMKVKISPLLLKTLLAISNSFYGEEKKEGVVLEKGEEMEKKENICESQTISKDEWLQKNSLERVPSKIRLNTSVTEKISIDLKSVRIKLYNEALSHRIPLLLINSSILSEMRDWSSELKLEADVSMEAWYHNENLAAWEPLMESEEMLSGRRLWQLQLKVCQSDSHLLSFNPDDKETFSGKENEDFTILATSPAFPNTRKETTFAKSDPNSGSSDGVDGRLREIEVEKTEVEEIEIEEIEITYEPPRMPSMTSEEPLSPQATYVVLSSYDIIQLNVTHAAVAVLNDVAKVFTDVTAVEPDDVLMSIESCLLIENELGIHTSVTVSERHEPVQPSTPDLKISQRRAIDIDDVIDGVDNHGKRHQSDSVVESDGRVAFYFKDDIDLINEDDEENDDGIVSDQVDGAHHKPLRRSVSMPASNMKPMIDRFSRNLEELQENGDTLVTISDPEEHGALEISEENQAHVGTTKMSDPKGVVLEGVNKGDCLVVGGTYVGGTPDQAMNTLIIPEIKVASAENAEILKDASKKSKEDKRFFSKENIKSDVHRVENEVAENKNGGSLSSKQQKEMDEKISEISTNDGVDEVDSKKKTGVAAPSFISGAFAAMGMIAGVSGHPITSEPLSEEVNQLQFERPQYKKADDYISIKIDGFKELLFVLISHSGRFLYQLSPKQNGRYYYVVVEIDIKHGQKQITIRAPLQVKNNLDIPIELLESGARRVVSADKHCQVSKVEPRQVVNVPLFSAHKGNLFVRPVINGFKKSRTSVSWKDFTDNSTSTILTCLPDENGPSYPWCVKVLCEKDSLNAFPSKIAPHHILQLYPTLSFWNFLPFPLDLNLEDNDIEEVTIKPGKHFQITSITTNKTLWFAIKIFDYMGTTWNGNFKLGGDVSQDTEVEMKPEETISNNKLLIKLDYINRGCLVVNIFSPYWIVNKTDLTITFKANKSSDETYKQLASNKEPLLFDSPKKKIMLKLNECDWSGSFSLDAVGVVGQLQCKETKSSRQYDISISIDLSENRLTKIITVLPKFVVINKTEHRLSLLEMGQKDDLWIMVKQNQCVPFWPRTESNSFVVKLNDSVLTSKVIKFDSIIPTMFCAGENILIEMTCEISESSTVIVFNAASLEHLPKIENLCENIAIELSQKNCGTTTIVSPSTSIVYCWDEPSEELTLLCSPKNYEMQPQVIPMNKDDSGEIELDPTLWKTTQTRTKTSRKSSSFFTCGCMSAPRTMSTACLSTLNDEACEITDQRLVTDGITTLYWVSFLNDRRRTILFTDDISCAQEARRHCEGEAVSLELFLSLDGVRLSVIDKDQSEVVHLGISSATSIWEVEKGKGKWKMLNVEISSLLEEAWRNETKEKRLGKDLEVDFETMLMKKPYRGLLNRRYEPGLWVQYCSAINYESFSAKIHRIQIDNQIFGTLYPCALYPSPIPVTISEQYGFKPFFEISTIYRNYPRFNLLHLRYFKVLVQEMNVMLEKDFLLILYNMIYGNDCEDDDKEERFNENLRCISLCLEEVLSESGSLDTQRIFLEYFHLSPLKINLSVSLQSNLYQSEKTGDSDLLEFLVNSVGAPLTVNDVLIKLAYFERCGLFITRGTLIPRVQTHYTWQVARQFHAIVLGLDVLGNPYGLFTDIGEGVKDLFYEPYKGIVSGPQEFASGVVRGFKSLLGHAIGGTAGAMSGIAGTFGQAFASLSMDQDYRMKRRLRMRNGPTGIQDAVTMGGKSLIMGLYFGVSGVVTKPIQGAKAEGVEGFFKGVGKGILGLVTRPTVGVFDMVSTTLDGIRRSAEQGGENIVARMRIPRFSPPDAPLRPYIEYQANGNGILKSLPRNDDVFHDIYVDHIPLPETSGSAVALLTNLRFMVVYQTMFWSEWKIRLKIPYDDIINHSRVQDDGIQIQMKDGEIEVVESTDQSTLQIMQKKLQEQLYNHKVSRTNYINYRDTFL